MTSKHRASGIPSRQREAIFHPEFRQDLRFWVETERKVALRAFDLVEAIMTDPFRGIGKPEPLKYLLAGAWSRRLTQEHRIVYLVAMTELISSKRDTTTDLRGLSYDDELQ